MKALIVIDIQKGLTSSKKLYNKFVLFATVNSAISKFREQNNLIIFVQHNNRFLVKNSPEWEFDTFIDKRESDLTIQKYHGNSFQTTELKTLLQKNGINEIFFCGLTSHGCVKYSCLGGLENGFACYLLSDAHTCWNKNAKEKIDQTEREIINAGAKIIAINDL